MPPMHKRLSIFILTILLLSGTYGIVCDQTNAETPNTPVNKYQAINILFWYFKIDTNKDYLPPQPKLQQYYKDIWPANPYYAYVNTACEIKLFPCSVDSFFDGEAYITLPAFLHMFYTLKYRDNFNTFQTQFLSYQGTDKDFPYLNEAIQSNIIDANTNRSTIATNVIFEMLRRDKILSTYNGILSAYFDGLETDTSQITTVKYYNIEKIIAIINQYNSIIPKQVSLLSTITDTTTRTYLEEEIKLLSDNLKTFTNIEELLGQNPLFYDPTIPDTIKQAAVQYGIREKVGESSYDYTKSPSYRRFNIETALNKINGTVLQPGEEFSFSKIIYNTGMREFKMGWVINKGKEEQAVGGGICGAATTVFMAAYRSGLQITERKQHSVWYRSFYSMDILGLDAAVYRPRPDMRFVNNTGAPLIMVVTYPSPSVANFQIWGTKHFDTLRLDGPNYNKGHTRWVRTIWYHDGTMAVDEILSYFGKRI